MMIRRQPSAIRHAKLVDCVSQLSFDCPLPELPESVSAAGVVESKREEEENTEEWTQVGKFLENEPKVLAATPRSDCQAPDSRN